jgi:hypothetical protein
MVSKLLLLLSVMVTVTTGYIRFVDDGVRSLDDQHQCLKVFKQVLSELDIDYEEIGTKTMKLSDRVDTVLRLIQDPSPRL